MQHPYMFLALSVTTWLIVGMVKIRLFGDDGWLIMIADKQTAGAGTWMVWPALATIWLLWPMNTSKLARWWFFRAMNYSADRIRQGLQDDVATLAAIYEYGSHDLYTRTWKEMK